MIYDKDYDFYTQKYPVNSGDIIMVNSHHYIVCGDCGDKELLYSLFNSHPFQTIVTDPPYMKTDIAFDEDGFDIEVFRIFQEFAKPNASCISFGSIELLYKIGLIWKSRFGGTWVKHTGNMRTWNAKKPKSQSEIYYTYVMPEAKTKDLIFNKVLYEDEPYIAKQSYKGALRGGKSQLDRACTGAFTKDGYVYENSGTREYTDTFYHPSKQGMKHVDRTLHPTQKPYKILEVMIQWVTDENMIVFDPFIGSGSTLIAAENTGRQCIGIEKNPLWCSVMLERFDRIGYNYTILTKV